MIWDTPEKIQHAAQQVEFILHGCKCRSGCSTRRCKFNKGGRLCGPGCQCLHCTNSTSRQPSVDSELEMEEVEEQSTYNDSTDTSSDEWSNQENLEGDVNQMMQSIFGDSDSDDDHLTDNQQ